MRNEMEKINNVTFVRVFCNIGYDSEKLIGEFQVSDERNLSRTSKPYCLNGQLSYRSKKQAINAGKDKLAELILATYIDFDNAQIEFLSDYFNRKYPSTTVRCEMSYSYSRNEMNFTACAAKLDGIIGCVVFSKTTNFFNKN